MNYTIEQFQTDFEMAPNVDAKSDILTKALNELDFSIPEAKEVLLQYKNEFKDYKEQLEEEEDKLCNDLIERGEYEVFICKENSEEFGFEKDSSYYIKIDDVAQVYEASITSENPIIKEYISKIEPIVWFITDNGIGTKKRRKSYPKSVLNFEQMFERFSLPNKYD
jgi:hypothetical protein